MIPLARPDVTDDDVDAVVRVLRSGRLSLGGCLEQFERRCADYLGAPHAVAVNSGTSALQLALEALGVGAGDEVVTPAFSFVASAVPLLQAGAVPVFVEIERDTFSIDPARIEAAITPRTRAILVVHVFGRPAPMAPILDIARRHGLLVIEDACEAFGAEIDGARAGALGDAGVFAFYPNKQITTGEGGLVVTRDPGVAARIASLRNQGRDPSADWLEHAEPGYSYRLSELHCALGVSQLARIEELLERRAFVAREYDRRLSGLSSLRVPPLDVPHGRISWFAYVVTLADRFDRAGRDDLVRALRERGIECGRYFAPIHHQPCFRRLPGFADLCLPVTEHVAARTVALPFFTGITQDQMDAVAAGLHACLAARGAK